MIGEKASNSHFNMDLNQKLRQKYQEIQSAVFEATKASNAITSNSDFDYYNSFQSFTKVMQVQQSCALSLLSQLAQKEQLPGRKPIASMPDDEDKFESLLELNDLLFDRIGPALDEAANIRPKEDALIIASLGTKKDLQTTTSSWNQVRKRKHDGAVHLLTAKSIQRPQLKFRDKIDNRTTPFIPSIKEKPNSIKPLAILPEVNEFGETIYSHPYETEIEKFKPQDHLLNITTRPPPLQNTPLMFIDTKEDLVDLIQTLKNETEIAVDLEHHSYRTFQGFTCLIQISTRKVDYIIDSIELRSEIHLLNEVFTNPRVVKVFHGADMDIIWLQRDFGVYVVNLFDTGQAARVLSFAHLSLAFLLKHYCNIEVDKKFQLADWRMRPLPDEMLKYAREDTHYLLFIYDKMRNDLVIKGNESKNLIRSVFERSKFVCLKKYEKPLISKDSHMHLVKKSRAVLNSRQLYCLKELYAWRDQTARNEDESIGYVLPSHMMLKIAEVLPREQQGILACCNPIPPLVKQQLNEIHLLILKARDMPLEKLKESNPIENQQRNFGSRTVDYDEIWKNKHDVHGDWEHNLPTLFEETVEEAMCSISSQEDEKPTTLPLLMTQTKQRVRKQKVIDKINAEFISPFQRYKTAHEERLLKEELVKKETLLKKEKAKEVDKSYVDNVQSHYVELVSSAKKETKTKAQTSSTDQQKKEQETELSVKDQFKFVSRKKPQKRNIHVEVNTPTEKTTEKSQQANVKPFDYQSYDYQSFTKTNTQNKTSFNPFSSQEQNNRKNRNKFKNKGNKSLTYSQKKQ